MQQATNGNVDESNVDPHKLVLLMTNADTVVRAGYLCNLDYLWNLDWAWIFYSIMLQVCVYVCVCVGVEDGSGGGG